MSWSEKQLDKQQTAMFDLMLDQVVPSLKSADREIPKCGKCGKPRELWSNGLCPDCTQLRRK